MVDTRFSAEAQKAKLSALKTPAKPVQTVAKKPEVKAEIGPIKDRAPAMTPGVSLPSEALPPKKILPNVPAAPEAIPEGGNSVTATGLSQTIREARSARKSLTLTNVSPVTWVINEKGGEAKSGSADCFNLAPGDSAVVQGSGKVTGLSQNGSKLTVIEG